jgi:hypothetical protein
MNNQAQQPWLVWGKKSPRLALLNTPEEKRLPLLEWLHETDPAFDPETCWARLVVLSRDQMREVFLADDSVLGAGCSAALSDLILAQKEKEQRVQRQPSRECSGNHTEQRYLAPSD